MKSEFELIERFKKIIPRKMQGLIPIGDDTGLISGARGSKWLFTTDVIVEGVDFIHGQIKPEMAGRKAVAVNLSDIAAMGGTPAAFVAALGIPKGFPESWIEKFYQGMIVIARKHRTLFVGGDISRSKELFASIAMIGHAPAKGPLLRSGARPGDWIGVTGELGGSILRRHYGFDPRIVEGKFLAEDYRASAAIDISDGLAQDLEHILKASSVGATIDIQKIPISSDVLRHSERSEESQSSKKEILRQPRKGAASLKTPQDDVKRRKCQQRLKHALTDGEDFELLFTMGQAGKRKLEKVWRKKFPRTRLSWIGRIQKEKGIRWMDHAKPVRLPFKTTGFRHFQ
ncbi:MAG TPA: thiamine-phosphate kinase [bacterium]|nr:thiamine-phosphate kinase [bacterium]